MKDKELFDRLKNGDEIAFQTLYSQHFNMVKYLVVQNSGDMDQAADIFQEVMVVLFEGIRDNKFELKAGIKTLCYSIARNLWLKELRRRKVRGKWHDFERYFEYESTDPLDEKEWLKKADRVAEALTQIGDGCKQLLTGFYYMKKNLDQLASELGYQNTDSVKTQKYKCLQKLKTLANLPS